jgi:HSP20 family protein
MALVRWEPAREVGTLQNEMNRLFTSFFDDATRGGTLRRWTPAMDVAEVGDEYVIKADLPGLTQDDVSIEVDGNVLTVSGERRAEHEDQGEGYYRVERSFGAFSRSLQLPEGTDAEAVKAAFEHGVLEIRVPKPEQRKPRRVAISVGQDGGHRETLEGDGRESGEDAAAA